MGVFTTIKSLRRSSLNILILGLDNSGKTTILTTFTKGNITTISPTTGFNLKTATINGNNLTLWDLGGQTTFRYHWRNYYATADILIFVIDSSDLRRLEECGRELRGVLDACRVPLLVLANKQDLVNALDGDEVGNVLI
jgi:small GTP-binding protein